MKIRIQQWITLKTERLQEIVIESDDYPELRGKSNDESEEIIDERLYDMTPTDPDSYDTLGDELDESFTGQEHTPRPEESEISVIFD